MNSNPQSRFVQILTLVSLLALAAPGVLAQEEAAEDEGSRLGSFRAEIESWIAQPAGLEYTSATLIDPDSAFSTKLLSPGYGTEDEFRYRLHYDLPSDFGTFVGTYYVHTTETAVQQFTPGDFLFGEQLTHSLFAGVDNDGRADGYIATTDTGLKEIRLDFQRSAFRSPRVSLDWLVGWRRVKHNRSHEAAYYALLPDIPSLIPPAVDCGSSCPDLYPSPDTALMESAFEGRGPTVGLDVDMPLWRDKLVFEGGVAMSVLRGEMDSRYRATNNFYTIDMQDGISILGPPYDEFGYYVDPARTMLCQNPLDCSSDPNNPALPASNFIDEVGAAYGLEAEGRSTTNEVFEINLGFRWFARKWLEVSGGFRSARYTDVGVDLRPKIADYVPNDSIPEETLLLNAEDVDEVDRSVTYEGFYIGATFRVF